jgi:hypothetical protein
MNSPETLKALITAAFAERPHPGDNRLRGSNEGDEPYLLQEEFMGKYDWHTLDSAFIDQAPAQLGSALSFFSDEAFRYYLPAYLIADIDAQLRRANPVFHLCHGLTDDTRSEKVNALRYGEKTWFDVGQSKFSKFTREETTAIIAYLEFKRSKDEFDAKQIDQALRNYWLDRAKGN